MSRPRSRVAAVHVVGPLAPLAPQFTQLLAERGYTPLSRVNQLRVMVHLSRWMQAGALDVADLTFERVDEYLTQRRIAGYGSFCSRASLARLLDLLAACGAPLLVESIASSTGMELLLAGFADYLRRERGLAASTTTAYMLRARRLVVAYGHGADLTGLDSRDVTRAVLQESGRAQAGSTQMFVVAVRSFLRYGYLTGLVPIDLSGASLPVTGRRRSILPQGISPADARALLKSCDRRTPTGRRDYAVILMLLRLGLRSCEVAALLLDDIDWRAGRSPCTANEGESISCRCRSMSARPSPPTCAMPDPATTDARCS